MVKKLLVLLMLIGIFTLLGIFFISHIAVAIMAISGPFCNITADVLEIEKTRTDIEGKGSPPRQDFDYFKVKLNILNISSKLNSGRCNNNNDCLSNLCLKNNCVKFDGKGSCDYSYMLSLNKSGQKLLLSEYDKTPISVGQKIKSTINCRGDEWFSGCFLSDVQIIEEYTPLNRLAYDLSDFPEPFIKNKEFNGVGAVGENAKDIVIISDLFFKLQENYNIPSPPQQCGGDACITLYNPPFKIYLDKDMTNISQDIISIGGPCANKITAQIMDLPITWPECALGFEEGIGRIKIYNKWNKTQLIIAGYNGEDTKKVAEVLVNYDKHTLSGFEIEVIGKVSNQIIERVITEEEKYCEKDEDCVPAQCCHATSTVNRKYAPDCTGISCTAVCSGSLDCGCGKPVCINHKCGIKKINISGCPWIDLAGIEG